MFLSRGKNEQILIEGFTWLSFLVSFFQTEGSYYFITAWHFCLGVPFPLKAILGTILSQNQGSAAHISSNIFTSINIQAIEIKTTAAAAAAVEAVDNTATARQTQQFRSLI